MDGRTSRVPETLGRRCEAEAANEDECEGLETSEGPQPPQPFLSVDGEERPARGAPQGRGGRGAPLPACTRARCLCLVGALLALLMVRYVVPVVAGRVDEGMPPTLDGWTVVRGSSDLAIVMLDNGGSKTAQFRFLSVVEKAEYARLHNYTLIACPVSLDLSRPAHWSKFKILYRVLQSYPTVMWLDMDTLVWDRKRLLGSVLDLDGSRNRSLIAQLDLHRTPEERLWNSGVFVMRNTTWSREALRKIYRRWDIVLLYGTVYTFHDQSGWYTVTRSDHNSQVKLYKYGGLWTLPKHAARNPFILHFPNCGSGWCMPQYLNLYRRVTEKHEEAARAFGKRGGARAFGRGGAPAR